MFKAFPWWAVIRDLCLFMVSSNRGFMLFMLSSNRGFMPIHAVIEYDLCYYSPSTPIHDLLEHKYQDKWLSERRSADCETTSLGVSHVSGLTLNMTGTHFNTVSDVYFQMYYIWFCMFFIKVLNNTYSQSLSGLGSTNYMSTSLACMWTRLNT